MPQTSDWQPTCSLRMLQQRAMLRQCVRDFFMRRDYLEVDTPLLSGDIVIDTHLHPLQVEPGQRTLYLQTSPEASMKRLVAAGSGSIFQLTSAFRGDESGRLHNPEFTMLEWYGVGTTWQEQIQLTEDLIRTADATFNGSSGSTVPPEPFRRTSYQAAFRQQLGIDVLDASIEQLQQCVHDLTETPDLPAERDDLLNLLLATAVEPALGSELPEFLVDYPASQAALAELSADDARVARRFELFLNGMEICNGYQELLDPDEFRRREAVQNRERRDRGSGELPGAPRLLAAMEAGLPACSGVALGFDRLLMLLTGAASISECLPFPIARA